MTLYEALLIAHVLAVTIWLGGSLVILLLWRRALATTDPVAVGMQAATGLWFDRRLVIPSSLVVLLAGGWLMNEGSWGMDQGWLHVGMAAVFAAAGVSLLWTGRMKKRVAGGAASSQLAGRITLGMVISIALMLVAFWAMIVKPFA
jgi:uncharacterized membrane protein